MLIEGLDHLNSGLIGKLHVFLTADDMLDACISEQLTKAIGLTCCDYDQHDLFQVVGQLARQVIPLASLAAPISCL